MSFDWSSIQAAQRARTDIVPEMINRALMVLADLLEEGDLACEFSLTTSSLVDNDVAASVKALLPSYCRVQGLQRVPCWRMPVSDALSRMFLPTQQPEAWVPGAPLRTLVETLTE